DLRQWAGATGRESPPGVSALSRNVAGSWTQRLQCSEPPCLCRPGAVPFESFLWTIHLHAEPDVGRGRSQYRIAAAISDRWRAIAGIQLSVFVLTGTRFHKYSLVFRGSRLRSEPADQHGDEVYCVRSGRYRLPEVARPQRAASVH